MNWRPGGQYAGAHRVPGRMRIRAPRRRRAEIQLPAGREPGVEGDSGGRRDAGRDQGRAAYRLTAEFYRRLFLEHGTVDPALDEVRAVLYEENELDWARLLYMRLRTGQLATPNPLWIAPAALEKHPDYTDFRENKYVPMPIMARVRGLLVVNLDGGNKRSRSERSISSSPVLDHLEGRPFSAPGTRTAKGSRSAATGPPTSSWFSAARTSKSTTEAYRLEDDRGGERCPPTCSRSCPSTWT